MELQVTLKNCGEGGGGGGGERIVFTYQTNVFNDILQPKQIPDSWHEAKVLIPFKRAIPRTHKVIGI